MNKRLPNHSEAIATWSQDRISSDQGYARKECRKERGKEKEKEMRRSGSERRSSVIVITLIHLLLGQEAEFDLERGGRHVDLER